MQIIKTNIDVNDKKAVYRMTKGETMKVSELEKGTSFPVDKWAIYTEDKIDSKGEAKTVTVLSIVSGGMKFATNSATFIRSFEEIIDIMGSDPFSIIIRGGTTKAGRTYQDCEMDCDV